MSLHAHVYKLCALWTLPTVVPFPVLLLLLLLVQVVAILLLLLLVQVIAISVHGQAYKLRHSGPC
jgi:hypothetical protein